MRFICETCDYDTDSHFCFQQHKNTKKHHEKVKRQLDNARMERGYNLDNDKKFQCLYCKKNFLNAGGMARHNKTCPEKIKIETIYENKLNEKDQIINQLNEQIKYLETINEKDVSYYKELYLNNKKHYESEVDTLKKEVHYLKTIINNAGNIIKSSVSAITYVSQNYGDAPALAPIKDYSKVTYDIDETPDKTGRRRRKTPKEIRKDKDNFIDLLILKNEKSTLERYLGRIIIKCYKKDNPKNQSLWSSDTSRLTYVVRELFNNKNIDWTVDKKGVKTRNYIINPLLEYINGLMKEYIKVYSITDINDIDMREYEPILNRMNKMAHIMSSIANGKLAEEILGYVTPEFYLNKENNLLQFEKS